MLTVARCREILGDDYRLTDAEVEELRDFVYGFADIALRIAREALPYPSSNSQGDSNPLWSWLREVAEMRPVA